MDGVNFKNISNARKHILEVEFLEEEVTDYLKTCDGNKSPDPDGFNKIPTKILVLMKENVVNLFKEFHSLGKFVRSLNSTFIVLIPKKKDVNEFKNFRTISLVGCIYTLIAKVLARKFPKVLGEVISESQHAFVGGRQILNAVMAANETVKDLVAKGNKGLICKLDMEKAYDHVSRNFVNLP